jgi:hypothetical protein
MFERDWDDFDEERWRAKTPAELEVKRIYAFNREHHWNSSTTVVRAIRDRLVAGRDE